MSDATFTDEILAGRYKVGRRLGVGGSGVVYEAVQVRLGRKVAIKILHPELAKRRDCLSRLEREARAAAGLGHENIVQVTDFSSEPGEVAFLVMELLRGRSMEQTIRKEGPLSGRRVAFIAQQVLSALSEAHEAGIIHRDLKPENIMLTSIAGMNDIVKLLDFGIAKLMDDTGNARLTVTGFNPGTPAFMSPEQARGAELDERTDIYSLGVVMFNALTGKLPFSGKNYNAMTYAILNDVPAPLSDMDSKLTAVVGKAMARDPDRRYQTAGDMASALEALSSETVTESEPSRVTEEETGKQEETAQEDWETIVTPPPMMDLDDGEPVEETPVTSVLPVEEALFGTPEERAEESEEHDDEGTPDRMKTTTLTRSAGERRETWSRKSALPVGLVAVLLVGLGLFFLLKGTDKPANQVTPETKPKLARAAQPDVDPLEHMVVIQQSNPDSRVAPEPDNAKPKEQPHKTDKTVAGPVAKTPPVGNPTPAVTRRPKPKRKPTPKRKARPRPRPVPKLKPAPKPRPAPKSITKEATRSGSLRIGALDKNGNPVWAVVLVDGVARGKTPVVVKGLKPGSHFITLRREGVPSVTRQVNVLAGQTASLVVELP